MTVQTTDILKESNFREVTEVKPDSKNRLSLGKYLHDIPTATIYKVYLNSSGQIILDPQITIPASEAWIYQNKEVFKAIENGLKDAKAGKVKEAKEDYSKYTTDKD